MAFTASNMARATCVWTNLPAPSPSGVPRVSSPIVRAASTQSLITSALAGAAIVTKNPSTAVNEREVLIGAS